MKDGAHNMKIRGWSSVTLFVLGALVVATGCSSSERDRQLREHQNEMRVEYVSKMLAETLKVGSGKTEVQRVLSDMKLGFKRLTGCYGNLGLSASACSEGETFVVEIPVPDSNGGGVATAYIFVHTKRGVLAHEIVTASRT